MRLKGIVLSFLLASPIIALASTNISTVAINGITCSDGIVCATVEPGDTVQITTSVTTTNSDDFESLSTNWYTDGVPRECHDTPDRVNSGTYTDSLNKDTPSFEDTFDLEVGAWGINSFLEDNNCNISLDDTIYLNGVLLVRKPPTQEEICVSQGFSWVKGACYGESSGSTDPSPYEEWITNGFTFCFGQLCTLEESERLIWKLKYDNDL